MTLLALSAALLLQGGAAAPGDTVPAFDSPATQALVERVIRAGSTVPEGLRDYHATMRGVAHVALRADSLPGGELPVTVDELAGDVRWERSGAVLQRVEGHRVRMMAPVPYTVGSMLESPWIIPHLYGNTISIFQLAPAGGSGRTRVARAVHPFSFRGVDLYRYQSGDTVRVRTQEGTTTLVPVEVRRRPGAEEVDQQLVVGTFWVDLDRAAVVRARFGFVARGGGFAVGETGVFFELESALVEGRYWLPYRQRREVQATSPLFGGAVGVRLVTTLSRFQVNTGWTPDAAGRSRLVWDRRRGDAAFEGWGPVGSEAEELRTTDFADLREIVRPPETGGPIQVTPRLESSDHLVRYNRVEGLFLGGGVRVRPRAVEDRDWEVYGTGGWAFAEGVPRGELVLRWRPGGPAVPPPAGAAPPARLVASIGAYRRLRDTQAFRPSLQWGLGWTLGAALAGTDTRDYYDAAGVEVGGTRSAGPLSARLGLRWERHTPVERNTERFLLGEADSLDFPRVAPADAGNHAAVEGEAVYATGAGAFGIQRSFVAMARAEAGLGDFRTVRLTGRLATRRPTRFVTVAGRVDGGLVTGEPPPQFLFRFGGTEGLRGYDPNAFGGSTAALAKVRVLGHLPPYSSQPLFRIGFFAMPPLRPSLVVSGDAGWAEVSERARPSLLRLGSPVTDGVRAAWGVGLSLFDDTVSAEWVRPSGGGSGKWYVGLVQWY